MDGPGNLIAASPQLAIYQKTCWVRQVRMLDAVAVQSNTTSQVPNDIPSVLSTDEFEPKTMITHQDTALFQKRNQKIFLRGWIQHSYQNSVISMFDTDTSPDLGDQSSPHLGWRKWIRTATDLRLKFTYSLLIRIEGTIKLVVRLGDQPLWGSVEVVHNLVVNIRSGTLKIEWFIAGIFLFEQRIVSIHSKLVATLLSYSLYEATSAMINNYSESNDVQPTNKNEDWNAESLSIWIWTLA